MIIAQQPKPFQWTAVILDDHPNDPECETLRAAIEKMGIKCEIAAEGKQEQEVLSILADQKFGNLLRRKHLISTDMKWDKCGKAMVDAIAQEDESGHIRCRGGLGNLCKILINASEYTSSSITDLTVGLWLSAVISYENPDAEIVFKSSSDKVTGDPVYMALERFAKSPFSLLRMPGGGEPKPAILQERLESLQRRALAYSEEARAWLIGGLLLPRLLDIKSISGLSGPLRDVDGRDMQWKLIDEQFFPQLRDSIEAWPMEMDERSKRLADFIEQRVFRLSVKQRQAIESAKHGLKNLQGKPMLIAADFGDILRHCSMAGFSGQAIFLQTQKAQQSLLVKDIDNAIRTAAAAMENSTRRLDDFCWHHGGRFDCETSLLAEPSENGEGRKADRLPFDLAHLQRSVEALIHNLKGNCDGEDMHRVSSFQTQQNLAVKYVDNSKGFADMASLAAQVAESLKKESGLDRGLPLALSFPFFYPFTKLEMMTKDKNWNVIFPYKAGTQKDEESLMWNFGVRWTFEMKIQASTGETHD